MTTERTAPAGKRTHIGRRLLPARVAPANLIERLALPGAWLALVIVFGALRPTEFLTAGNFESIFGSQAVLVVLTCGLLIPLTAGDYDLSITGTLMLSQMMLGVLQAQHGWALSTVIPLCLATGAVVGSVNGALVMVFGIDPFIVTLGTGTFLQGIVLWISNSMSFSGISTDLVNVVVVDRFLGIPLEFYYGLGLCAVLWYLFEFTAMGRRLLFVGRGRDVARLSGLRVGRLRWGALVASGVISAAAGILYAGTTGSADPTSGSSYLLPAFAAAFLGATTIAPGRFNPWGSFVAVYFLVTGITGLSLLGVRSFTQDLFYGGALVIAVTLSQLARSRAAHESGPRGTS
ncbi:MAG: ribose transport system permease protein [Baekduia sp.]|jgi:ribose transport system permease protein|nr:ribose transport system permease protein [Baekduia sp.]MEA2283018.1 ribose transport system permease protein [Solirubrobacteraceae bacterium]